MRAYDFHYNQTVEPTTEPVTLADMQTFITGFNTDDNALVSGWLKAARQQFEQETGLALVAQTWALTFRDFPPKICLRKGPVRSITSITYYDTTGTQQTLSTSVYRTQLSDHRQIIDEAYGQTWPAVEADREDAVTVTFVAGIYATTGASPDAIDTTTGSLLLRRYGQAQQAIKMLIAHWYDNREMAITGTIVQSIPKMWDDLVASCRVSF